MGFVQFSKQRSIISPIFLVETLRAETYFDNNIYHQTLCNSITIKCKPITHVKVIIKSKAKILFLRLHLRVRPSVKLKMTIKLMHITTHFSSPIKLKTHSISGTDPASETYVFLIK